MKTYLIGYDLNSPGQNYNELIKAIETFSTRWHELDSTWIIKSDLKATEVRDLLTPHLDKNDEILVVELNGVGAWRGFSDKNSKWLVDNL